MLFCSVLPSPKLTRFSPHLAQNSFNTSYFEYQISVRRVVDTEFKTDEFQYSEFPSAYEHWNRHGVRLLFLRLGTVGTFDFQTLLINIIAGSALVRTQPSHSLKQILI